MVDPAVEQIEARCDYYAGQVDLYRDAMLGDADAATIDNTLDRFDSLSALLFSASSEAGAIPAGAADNRAARSGRCLRGTDGRAIE